jgi:mRNA-degrading endonuclease RelE of RelBE toxin-antitoxin system
MIFQINFSPNAEGDFDYFDAYEQRIIMAAIKTFLVSDANIPTKKRKQLRDNAIAPWELKQDKYRIFYNVVSNVVEVLAIGYKYHNSLYIRGKRISL